MRAKFVNEGIKHLKPRSNQEITDEVNASGNTHYKLFMGVKYDIEEAVKDALERVEANINNWSERTGSDAEDLLEIGNMYLENKEITILQYGSWYFDKKGNLQAKLWDGKLDEEAERFIEFLKGHNITTKPFKKKNPRVTFGTNVLFTGKAKDILALVIEFNLVNFGFAETSIEELNRLIKSYKTSVYESIKHMPGAGKEAWTEHMKSIDAEECILSNGKKIWVYEDGGRGFAGESISYLRYADEGGTELYYEDIEKFFSNKDRKEITDLIHQLAEDNEASAISFVM